MLFVALEWRRNAISPETGARYSIRSKLTELKITFPENGVEGKKNTNERRATQSDGRVYTYIFILQSGSMRMCREWPQSHDPHTQQSPEIHSNQVRNDRITKEKVANDRIPAAAATEKKHNCFRPRRAHTSMDESRRLSAYHFHYGIQYQISLTQISDKRVYLFE